MLKRRGELYAAGKIKSLMIMNNPNNRIDEVGTTRYILDLLLSVINVSVQSVGIVEGLPKIEFETES